MGFAEKDLIKDFEAIGIKSGDVLLVHSSLKSIGYVVGGAETVIKALLKVLGDNGTLVMPTFTGSEKLSAENPPYFDVKNSVCWTGLIPETFRKMEGVRRSLHPTHSVAVFGKKGEFLIKNHFYSKTPCDKKSPFYKLVKVGGKILLLGVTLDSMTLIHTVEELAKVSYHIQEKKVEATVIDERGEVKKRFLYIHKYGTPRYFRKIESESIEKGVMVKVSIGNAVSYLTDAKKFFKLALKKIKEDKDYFIVP